MTGERVLWQAVVYRAFRDATDPKAKSIEAQEHKAEADTWIRQCGRDFRHVCLLAGMDADFLSDAYILGRVDPELLRATQKGGAA